MRYSLGMDTVILLVLALVVALVAIDAIARLDERGLRRRAEQESSEERPTSTQKIVVDLTKRS